MTELLVMFTTTDQQLITAFVAHQKVRGFSARTIDRRVWSLEHLARAGELGEHTPTSIEIFLSRWPSAQSRYSIRSDVHQFYRWAIRRGLLTTDPTDGVDPPRLPKRAATPLSSAQLRAALAATRNNDERIAIMLGAYAGLRCSEIAALDMGDVHRGSKPVIVVRQGKGGVDGVVPLAPELAAALPLHGKAVPYRNGQSVGHAIRQVFRRAGVKARPHDLRHTFCTAVAKRANGNLRLAQRLMRHASITATERYIRWNPEGSDVVAGLHDDELGAAA